MKITYRLVDDGVTVDATIVDGPEEVVGESVRAISRESALSLLHYTVKMWLDGEAFSLEEVGESE